MSLRQRLVVVLLLGLSALVFGVLAIGHVIASGDAARERAGQANADAGAQALAEALAGHVEPGALREPADGDLRKLLQTTAASAVRPVANAAGGYCLKSGALLASAAGKAAQEVVGRRLGGRPNDPMNEGPTGGKESSPATRPHPLAHDLRAAVNSLCQQAHGGEPVQARIEHPHDVEMLSAVAVGDDGAAWFLWRVRTRPDGPEGSAWPYEIAFLAFAAVALAAVTLDAILALGRGATQLRGALGRLETDLRAPVPRPRARELRDIAGGLETMAVHLADARDRERALSSTLAREQRLAALGRVVAGVAHEVRNPLAGMKLRLDLLDRDPAMPAGAREDVAACLGEVARLNRLVESLLTVSRAKATTREPLDLGRLAGERVEQASASAAAAGVSLVREGGGVAQANRDAVAGALDNLLRNAIEASPPGGQVRVAVGTSAGAVVLDVEDQGPGVPEDRRAEMFEPFFTTKAEGTGLGLWISRLLLEAGGARVSYERVGARTRLRVTFPEA